LDFLFAIKGGLAGTKNVDHSKVIEENKKVLRDSLGKLIGSVDGSIVEGVEIESKIKPAEGKLSEAAAMIEGAAMSLLSSENAYRLGKNIDDMDFEDQILGAAKSIANATSALIRYKLNIYFISTDRQQLCN
jgi:hypothetical protein